MLPPSEKHWYVLPPIPETINTALHDYPSILRQLLYNRGITTSKEARQYIQAEPPENTEAENLLGVPEATERLRTALQQGESIAIYGDYDADGVTATALLALFLKNLGGQVQGYIPNRFDEGYGLNIEALSALKEAGVQLVVTVDCGIRSPQEAEYARKIELDLIITDHHHPGSSLPEAVAVINPKQLHDIYPDKNLAGVGLAYKLACGLATLLENENVSIPPGNHPDEYLDLVALGTVADLAPLTGENRALVRKGLELIHRAHRQGLRSLIGAAGLKPEKVNATDLGFALGPRLNAAGRLESALEAYNLLTTSDVDQAGKLAQRLDDQNRKRQQITREMQAQAEALLGENIQDQYLLFAVSPEFNPGVVGLVASRLTEQYYRPAIVAQYGEEFTRGSCRSIPEFHITEALDQCASLLHHHGGHAAAAGFTVRNEYLPVLQVKLQAIASNQLKELDLRPTLTADLEITLHELYEQLNFKPSLLQYLEWLQPTGYGNLSALFISRGLNVKSCRAVGNDNSHLKLTVSDGRITYDAIAFRQGFWAEQMPPKVDLMYRFEVNEFNGRETLQLNVRDIKPWGEGR